MRHRCSVESFASGAARYVDLITWLATVNNELQLGKRREVGGGRMVMVLGGQLTLH